VSGVAEAAALAVLADARDWVAHNVDTVRRNRERLRDALVERGLRVPSSAANFILAAAPAGHPLAQRMTELGPALRRRGVAVRAFSKLRIFGDAIRISIGPWPMMQKLLDALDAEAAARSADAEITSSIE
jgi:histidinol-phosphate/aromatic aminotransferase/cobyric acid decarboxylase-like protein